MVDWAWIPHVAFVLISKSKGRNLVFLFYVPIHSFVSQKHFGTGLGIDLLCVSSLWVSFLCSAYYFMRTQRWISWKLLWISANSQSWSAIFSSNKMNICYHYSCKITPCNEKLSYNTNEVQHHCQYWEVLQKRVGPFAWLLWLPPIFKAEEYPGIMRQGKFTSLAFDKQKHGTHIV